MAVIVHQDLALNSPELPLLKFLLSTYHHSHFLDFISFLQLPNWWPHTFYSWAVLGLDNFNQHTRITVLFIKIKEPICDKHWWSKYLSDRSQSIEFLVVGGLVVAVLGFVMAQSLPNSIFSCNLKHFNQSTNSLRAW